jgi:hypothetical protein
MTLERIFAGAVAFAAVLLLGGCGHNIHVKGWGIATPGGAIGCGSFSCVKENTSVEVFEKTPQMESKSKFSVGDQTTGYDVKMEDQKKLKSFSQL